MKKAIFKWLNRKSIESPIFWLITEDMVQEEAEQEIDRKLTENELKELIGYQYGDEDFDWHRMVMAREAIRKVIKKGK